MKSKQVFIIAGLVVVVGAVAGAIAVTNDGAPAADASAAQQQMPPMPVDVATAESQSMVDAVRATGRIEAIQAVELRPDEGGRITKLLFAEGQRVATGAPLITIDDALLRAQAARATAERDLARQQLARVQKLRAENAALQAKLDAALKRRFGRRSERRAPPPAAEKPPRRRDEHGRSPLPEHLERREVVHDLTEAEKLCPCCGRSRACIGARTAEQLDLEPARFFVLRTVKKSYACRHCDPTAVPAGQRIQTAGPSQVGPIPKGMCGPGLLAHAITAKFADHTPLHRLAGQLARSGVAIARSTLGDWLAAAADLLSPLHLLMHQRLPRIHR